MSKAKEQELERVITELLECYDFEANTDLLIRAMNTELVGLYDDNGDFFTIGNLTRGAMRVLLSNWDKWRITEEQPEIVGMFVISVIKNYIGMRAYDPRAAERINLYMQMFLAEDEADVYQLHLDFILGVDDCDCEELDEVEVLH